MSIFVVVVDWFQATIKHGFIKKIYLGYFISLLKFTSLMENIYKIFYLSILWCPCKPSMRGENRFPKRTYPLWLDLLILSLLLVSIGTSKLSLLSIPSLFDDILWTSRPPRLFSSTAMSSLDRLFLFPMRFWKTRECDPVKSNPSVGT